MATTTSGLPADRFGPPNNVVVVSSSKWRWFKPRYHVVVTDGDGHVSEVYHDATVLQMYFLRRYIRRVNHVQ